MKRLKKLRKDYINYLRQNPKSFKFLEISCDYLGITKSDFS